MSIHLIVLSGDVRPERRIFWPAVVARFRFCWPCKIVVDSVNLLYLPISSASSHILRLRERAFSRLLVRRARSLGSQVMIVTSVILPTMLAAQTVDMMRGVFLCFPCALILNVLFILGGSVTIARYGSELVDIGHQGYFLGKNYLGKCAAVVFFCLFTKFAVTDGGGGPWALLFSFSQL